MHGCTLHVGGHPSDMSTARHNEIAELNTLGHAVSHAVESDE